MFQKLTIILLSVMCITSIGFYIFIEQKINAMEREIEVSEKENGKIGEVETATAFRGFAHLEEEEQDVSFLEVEIKRIEAEKQKEEERKRLEEEKRAKEEAERKAKEEAEIKAKEEAEQKAKEEAERQALVQAEAERKAKEEKERKEEAERKSKEEAEKEAKKQVEQEQSKKSESKNTNASNDEITALAKMIHAEAKGESYQGRLAVGAVIMNRVNSSKFPNSIQGVLNQPKQFQPMSNGAYNRAKPSDLEYKAAREALNGVDPTGGALYFYAPSIATTSWHESLNHTTTIGSHKFFK